MSTLKLQERVENGAETGFTLDNAIGEALGYVSVCWDAPSMGVFQEDKARAAWDDLRGAILAAVKRAVNAQGIDADARMTDWQLAELIGQSAAFGFEEEQR